MGLIKQKPAKRDKLDDEIVKKALIMCKSDCIVNYDGKSAQIRSSKSLEVTYWSDLNKFCCTCPYYLQIGDRCKHQVCHLMLYAANKNNRLPSEISLRKGQLFVGDQLFGPKKVKVDQRLLLEPPPNLRTVTPAIVNLVNAKDTDALINFDFTFVTSSSNGSTVQQTQDQDMTLLLMQKDKQIEVLQNDLLEATVQANYIPPLQEKPKSGRPQSKAPKAVRNFVAKKKPGPKRRNKLTGEPLPSNDDLSSGDEMSGVLQRKQKTKGTATTTSTKAKSASTLPTAPRTVKSQVTTSPSKATHKVPSKKATIQPSTPSDQSTPHRQTANSQRTSIQPSPTSQSEYRYFSSIGLPPSTRAKRTSKSSSQAATTTTNSASVSLLDISIVDATPILLPSDVVRTSASPTPQATPIEISVLQNGDDNNNDDNNNDDYYGNTDNRVRTHICVLLLIV